MEQKRWALSSAWIAIGSGIGGTNGVAVGAGLGTAGDLIAGRRR